MSKSTLKIPEPPKEVGWVFTDGNERVRIGLADREGKLEAFAATDRKKGKHWVQQARSSVAPNLPGPVGVILAGALERFNAKKAEVETTLKATRPRRPKKSRGARTK